MGTIPLELVEQVERGNALLFVGDRITCDDMGRNELDSWAAELARRCEMPGAENGSFLAASQLYEDIRGRQALVQFVRDKVQESGDEPAEVHQLIAALAECRLIVTTCLDRRLECALAEAERTASVLVHNYDVAFVDEQKTQVYRLRGAVEQADSLVLTEDDCDQFFDDENSISVVLQGYLARNTILFLGHDLSDPNFKRLYRRVTANLDGFARRAYAFGQLPSPLVNSWCKRHGIEVIKSDGVDVLRELLQLVKARRSPQLQVTNGHEQTKQPEQRTLAVRPYKLLDYYGPDDANIYFAREHESFLLISLIHGHRLTLLYGASGTGKTSLLLAGVMPRLEAADPAYAVVYVRVLESPVAAVRRQVQRRLGDKEISAEIPFVKFLEAAVVELGRPLVLILDQFEEFFMRLSDQERKAFIVQLADLHETRDLAVKVVICIREDWLAQMNEVRTRVPDIFNVDMRLLPLTPEQAIRAITAPLKQVAMEMEPALVDRLLNDLGEAQREASGTETTAALMPPHLQLICDALYEKAIAQGVTCISLGDYSAVGEVSGVLATYIDNALRKFPSAQRELARTLLIALVSSQSTKYASAFRDISAELGADAAVVKEVLDHLVDQRLVRQLDDEHHYELAHDSLAATIASWINEGERQRKQIQEMVHRQEREWRQDSRFILGRGRFERINQLRSDLRLTPEEIGFVLRAALLYDVDVVPWLQRIEDQTGQMDFLLGALDDPQPNTRKSSAYYLGAYPHERVARSLARASLEDDDDVVRFTAAQSVGRLQLPDGFAVLTAAAESDEADQRARAIDALARALDEASFLLASIPRSLRPRLIVRLAGIRLHRHRNDILGLSVAGAVGGAPGIGMALGLLFAAGSSAAFDRPTLVVGDAPVFLLVFALIGMVAGACVGFGTGIGFTLSFRRPWLGASTGAILGGAASFALVLTPFLWTDLSSNGSAALSLSGTAIFGALVGLGAVLPLVWRWSWWASIFTGGIGGMAGIVAGGLLSGYHLFAIDAAATVPIAFVLASGTFIGLCVALGINYRESDAPYITRRHLGMDEHIARIQDANRSASLAPSGNNTG